MMDFDDIKEFLFIVTIVFLFIFLLVALIVAIIYPLEKYTCQKTAESMGLNWDYGFWIPCLVEVDDRWINIDNYNEVGVK